MTDATGPSVPATAVPATADPTTAVPATADPTTAEPATSDLATADRLVVPRPLRAASEWSWRVLLIAAGVALVGYVLGALSTIVVPVVVAILLTALVSPIFRRLNAVLPVGAAAGLSVFGLLIVLGGALTLVGSQFSAGFSDLTTQLASGLEQVRDWIRSTFKITDSQFNEYFDSIRNSVSKSGNIGDTAASIGLSAGHFVAGFFIALFTLFFLLYDGRGIWDWVVRLFPRAARGRVNSSGHIAWGQLSAFVRATVIVAAVDALGISIGAAVLGVPFALAIGVLVFIGAFIPIVGALLSGAVAVLLALVAQGPIVALIMLGVVIAVQQLESHVLQPLIMGRSVHVHPLAVILGIAGGSTLFGIVGALTAVPIMAVTNAVGKHLLSGESEAQIVQDAETKHVPEPADD